ncbi:glycosyltransferase family 4 protein [Patescibacteria group bacterium]|nr:glycosyltransferase family 4 protein [Patescibacteria group bacterium]
MIIGIDASRIDETDGTGTNNYSNNLIMALGDLDRKNKYVLYFRDLPKNYNVGNANVSTRILGSPIFWTQFRLSLECLTKPPEILFVPAHTIPIIRRPKLKTIVTVHDLGAEFLEAYHRFPQKIYLNWSTQYIARHATHMIAVSNSTKKDLMDTLKVPSSRISVVYEGVDHKFFYRRDAQEVRKVRLKYGLDSKYLLFVGTIQPRKNIIKLIQAYAKLQNRKVDLVLVGKPGWLYDEIYKAPKKYSVSSFVKFLGFVSEEDLPSLYSGSEAFVLPSLYEGFGLPILEAMACEVPVITSNTSSMPEVSGDNALLVKPNDVNDMSYNLSRILNEEDLRLKLKDKGREWARKFSWEKAAKETIRVFEKVYRE